MINLWHSFTLRKQAFATSYKWLFSVWQEKGFVRRVPLGSNRVNYSFHLTPHSPCYCYPHLLSLYLQSTMTPNEQHLQTNAIQIAPSSQVGVGGTVARLCRFFQNGHCRNGDACRFSHHTPNNLTREEALKTIPCPYFASGTCRFGESCALQHQEIRKNDDCDAICGICLDNVQDAKRNFGLLSCCSHPFCFSCVMEWRTEGSREVASRRVCPTCRKASDYVVPSQFMPTNDAEKEQIILNYKAHCATIPCKRFEVGILGSCSFGSDCFYAHLNSKGVDIKSRDKTMQELYEERQRGRHEQHEFERERAMEYMAEMIMMLGLQRNLGERGRVGRRGRRDRGTNRSGQRDAEESEDDEDSEDDNYYFPGFSGMMIGDDDDDSEDEEYIIERNAFFEYVRRGGEL